MFLDELGGGLEKFSDIGEMPALRENMKRNWAERGSVYAAQQMDWAVVYRNFLSGTPDLWRRAAQTTARPPASLGRAAPGPQP